MKIRWIFYAITCVLAFCSILYELVLAQSLSAFLENTVLRYSVTIGLYMSSMGFGSMFAEGRFLKKPVVTLLTVETLLTLMGGFSVIWLFLIDAAASSTIVLWLAAHVLIIVIGVLTGFEMPLLIEILRTRGRPDSEGIVFAFNYAGAFLGTVLFAFWFYPWVGLLSSSLWGGLLNITTGLLLLLLLNQSEMERQGSDYYYFLTVQGLIWLLIIVCLIFNTAIYTRLMGYYLQ